MGKNNKMVYCVRRHMDGCNKMTYNKEGLCSSCRDYLEELAENLSFIEMFKIKPAILDRTA